MWNNDKNFPARGFLTPPPTRKASPMIPMSERKGSSPANNDDFFHVLHKVPAGDSPYVRAKHVQVKDSWCFRMVWTNGFYLDFVVFDLNTHSC
jgi:hypothetical protein